MLFRPGTIGSGHGKCEVVSLRRRDFVAGAIIALASGGPAKAVVPQRVVTLEWMATEIALCLGVRPAGVADLQGYRTLVGIENALLADTIDVGRRQQPSLEAIDRLKPDAILSSAFRHRTLLPRLQALGPTWLIDDQPENGDLFHAVLQSVTQIGSLLGREDVATSLLRAFDRQLASLSEQAKRQGIAGRPIVIAQPLAGSARLRVFTPNSAVVQMLAKVGFGVGFESGSEPFGFTTIDLEGLAAFPAEADLVLLSSAVPAELSGSPLWPLLPILSRDGIVLLGDDVWPFGATASLIRLAERVVARVPVR